MYICTVTVVLIKVLPLAGILYVPCTHMLYNIMKGTEVNHNGHHISGSNLSFSFIRGLKKSNIVDGN